MVWEFLSLGEEGEEGNLWFMELLDVLVVKFNFNENFDLVDGVIVVLMYVFCWCGGGKKKKNLNWVNVYYKIYCGRVLIFLLM